MKALPATFVAALVFSAAPAMAAVTVLGSGPAQTCYDIAENGGDYAEGISQCTNALDDMTLSVRDRAATFVNRGVLHLGRHELAAGFKDIDSGIALDPMLADGYIDRGAASIALGHYDDALADLNKGITLGPTRPYVAYYDRAIVERHNDDVRSAYYDLRKALELKPDFDLALKEIKDYHVFHTKAGI